MKKKGFTLIELLVIIAIISILAGIIIAILGPARLKAKDAGVASVLSSYRTEAQLVFSGDFLGICSSPSFDKVALYIESQGGIISSCENDSTYYRIVAGLPSAFARSIPATAHAAGGDGYCINSLGQSNKINISNLKDIPTPSCTDGFNDDGYTSPDSAYYVTCTGSGPVCFTAEPASGGASSGFQKVPQDFSFCSNLTNYSCFGDEPADIDSFIDAYGSSTYYRECRGGREVCYTLEAVDIEGTNWESQQIDQDLSLCSHLPAPSCSR